MTKKVASTQQTTDPSLTYELKARALVDFWFFIELGKFKGGHANFDPVHRDLAYFLSSPQLPEKFLNGRPRDDFRRRFVMMHRSGFKSTLIVLYVLWRIYRNPDIRILYNSCDRDLTKSFLREIVQYLEDSWLQRNLWNNRPHVDGVMVPVISVEDRVGREYDKDMFAKIIAQKVVWNQDEIQVIRPGIFKEPTIATTSINMGSTGRHVDLIINDDLVNFENSDNPNKAKKIFRQAADLVSVLDPIKEVDIAEGFSESLGREIITTGTPYYKWDYNVYLEKEHERLGYVYFRRSIYVNDKKSDGYTCPSRFNDKVVEQIKAEIMQARGLKAWMAQYLLKIVDDETSVLRSSKVKKLDVAHIKLLTYSTAEVRIEGEVFTIRLQAALDPAASESRTANHSAMLIGGYLPTGDFCIVGGFKKKLLPAKLVQECFKWWDNFSIAKVTIEVPPSTGTAYIELFNRFRPQGSRVSMKGVKPTVDKNLRLETTLEPFLGEATTSCIYVVDSLYKQLQEEVDSLDLTVDINDDDLLDALEQLISNSKLRPTKPKTQTVPYTNRIYGGYL